MPESTWLALNVSLFASEPLLDFFPPLPRLASKLDDDCGATPGDIAAELGLMRQPVAAATRCP
jgi:hypothetical protein